MTVKEFDRVFYGYYMRFPFGIYPVYHCGQGGGFSASGRACNEYKAVRPFGEFFGYFRQPEVLKAFDVERYGPECPCCCAPLNKYICPEPAQPFDSEREVEFVVLFEFMFLGVCEDAVTKLLCVFRK